MTAVFGRAEARVAPQTGPGRRRGIGHRVVEGLLVRDERAVRRVRAVGARLVARLPVRGVAGERRDVDARVARGVDVGALRARPVLVVADIDEDLVVQQQRTALVGVDAGDVRDVVAVALEVLPHGQLGVGPPVARVVLHGDERTVVRNLVRTVRGVGTLVEAEAAVGVVRLPRGVGGLHDHRGVAAVVADDEDDVTLAAGVVARHQRDVHAGDGVGRDLIRRGEIPVAAVDETDVRVGDAGRLRLRLRGLRSEALRDETRAAAAVPTETKDVVVPRRDRRDLEADGVAVFDTDRRAETLEPGVTRALDLPVALRHTRLRVLADDRVAGRIARSA